MLPTLPPPSSPAGKRWHHYLKIAQRLVTTYRGEEPLSAFLKKYFAANKKHGGSDRKNIAALCYAYFRLGFSGDSCAEEIRWQAAIFLGTFITRFLAAAVIETCTGKNYLPATMVTCFRCIKNFPPQPSPFCRIRCCCLFSKSFDSAGSVSANSSGMSLCC
jgi:hypothetical protein